MFKTRFIVQFRGKKWLSIRQKIFENFPAGFLRNVAEFGFQVLIVQHRAIADEIDLFRSVLG